MREGDEYDKPASPFVQEAVKKYSKGFILILYETPFDHKLFNFETKEQIKEFLEKNHGCHGVTWKNYKICEVKE